MACKYFYTVDMIFSKICVYGLKREQNFPGLKKYVSQHAKDVSKPTKNAIS